MKMFYSSWDQRERVCLGLAVIAFMYAGAKLWIRHHPAESVVPILAGLLFTVWLIGQRAFKDRPILRGISFAGVLVLAALSGYAAFHF